ncbi:SMI1/KNR4 family protein [Actinomadura adrarensis]|uniref:SMI1/KNR4 family protein n=1 Tax=Actinomadura adrarensis TaxID=1819600 RepID=A0ABW3CQZ0_9ACTN
MAAWLGQNAPASLATLGPPATDDQIAEARDVLGMPLPGDLVAWWKCVNGTSTFPALSVVPLYSPLSVEAALADRERKLSSFGSQKDAAPLREEPAGTPCGIGWLPEWLPVAEDNCGWYLFVDLRPGSLRGCVMSTTSTRAFPKSRSGTAWRKCWSRPPTQWSPAVS